MGKNICEPFYMTNLVDWRVRAAIALGLNMFENTNKSGFCANVAYIFVKFNNFGQTSAWTSKKKKHVLRSMGISGS